MSDRLISKQWRQRLLYTVMSLFLAWHTVAMLVGPAPEGSVIVQSLRGIYGPYVTLFRLDNKWGFFAPSVGKWSEFRYVVEDAAGKRHTFAPARQLRWYLPTYIWLKDRYETIMESPDVHGDELAAKLCRRHADLKPVSITLLEAQEKEFLPAHHLAGKHPLSDEFVTVSVLRMTPCPDSK